jgi:hypothetical protein
MISVTDHYGHNLGFIDRSHYFFFQVAEWTFFQTHYFSENLVAPGIEPGTSGSVARNSRPLDHRDGHSFMYIKHNSADSNCEARPFLKC